MICKNKRCGRVIGEHYWGEGYCTSRCMSDSMRRVNGEKMSDRLSDPTDPTGRRAIAETVDEIDAMLEAAAIDSRLPRIIYLRRRRMSWRKVDKACNVTENTCRRLLDSVSLRLLKQCGL
jgi:hypothetical protein